MNCSSLANTVFRKIEHMCEERSVIQSQSQLCLKFEDEAWSSHLRSAGLVGGHTDRLVAFKDPGRPSISMLMEWWAETVLHGFVTSLKQLLDQVVFSFT